MTPESLREARRLFDQEGLKSFSFDLFDTMLLRRCTGPDGVYEQTLQLLDIPDRYKMLGDAFCQNRALAEMKARKANPPGEVFIEEIYRHFPRRLFGAGHLSPEQMGAAEFAAEKALCLLNPDMVTLYREARAKGLAVGFISDTYWARPRLEELLRHLGPDLEPDFLYASCEHGRGKTGGLFDAYLSERGLPPDQAAHIGDNPLSDVVGARARGITPVLYPQQPAGLSPVLRAEEAVARALKALRPDLNLRLDEGFRLMRRIASGQLGEASPAQVVGTTVLGPIMTAFQAFLEHRIAAIAGGGRVVKILFVARDGFLPYRIWQESGGAPAAYVEINRRTATLAASTDSPVPLQAQFRTIQHVNRELVDTFLKLDALPAVDRYFEGLPEGLTTGAKFAEDLPELVGQTVIREAAMGMRLRLLQHLQQAAPGVDQATDVVLVDLGYAGSVQRCLRRLFDDLGWSKRLHGVYMATVDDRFLDLPASDSVHSLLDDTIFSPAVKGIVLRNATIVEQCCSAPVGSIRDYKSGLPERERDCRPTYQIECCDAIREASLDYYRRYRRAVRETALDPFATGETGRLWAAVAYARLLTLPTLAELGVFGPMFQDPNMGSTDLMPMVDPGLTHQAMLTMPLGQVARLREPPAWPSGSVVAASRMFGYANAMSAWGLLPSDIYADEATGTVSVTVINRDQGIPVSVDCTWTFAGDIRLRIPLPARQLGSVVALPLKAPLARGVIRAISLQRGANVASAIQDRFTPPLAMDKVEGLRAHLAGSYFSAQCDNSYLLIPTSEEVRSALPPAETDVVVLTVVITPLPSEAQSLAAPECLPEDSEESSARCSVA